MNDIIQIAILILLAVIGALSYRREYTAKKVDGTHWFLYFSFELSLSMVLILFVARHSLDMDDPVVFWVFFLTYAAFASAAFLGAVRRIYLNLSETKKLRIPLEASILVTLIIAVIGMTLLALLS